jgi:hypothetical protein
MAIAGLAGIEFGISERWSGAVESIYWRSFDKKPLDPGEQENRFTIAAVMRVYPLQLKFSR